MSEFSCIYVTGVPGSGTTLMRRLFWAFEGCVVPEREMVMDTLLRYSQLPEQKGKLVVCSGHHNKLFPKGVEYAVENKIGVLVMCRDWESANASNGQCTRKRWTNIYSAAFKEYQHVDCLVNFYDLLENPDEVQLYISFMFDLEMKHKFSEYPAFIPPNPDYDLLRPKHRPRPLGASYENESTLSNRGFNHFMNKFDKAVETERETKNG